MADYPKNYGRFADARVWSVGDKCVQCPDAEGADQKEVDEKYYASIKESQCDLVDEKRWTACLSHLTKAPTLEKPKITQIDGGWKVAPRTVSILVLDYYIRPTDGTFKYTIVAGNPQTGAGDFIQYDTTSTPLEWPETVLNYFLWKLSTRYGMFIGNQFLAQFSKQQDAA